MINSRLHAAIALGSVLIVGAFVAFLPSVLPASERSQAQRICREEGISQASELHEICLAQTIRALEREDYWLARSTARVAADAHEACLRVGLQPEMDGFRWEVTEVYEDAGISGAKGREGRPAFDLLCQDATRRRFDVIAAWSVDRLGRSVQDLVGFLGETHGAGVHLYLHQQ